MISPLKIGLQGLAPGSSPIEIGTQGFILSITPPVEEADQDLGGGYTFMPMRWTPARTRQDCRIEVQGCRATLTATKENVGRNNLTSLEQDRVDDWLYAQELAARYDAEEEEQKQLHYLERLRWVTEALKMRNEQRAERRAFREAVESIASDLKEHDDPAEDIAGMLVGLSQQNSRMLARLQELEERLAEAEKPSPAKAKPAKGKK
jgi:hypothetical protein